MRQTNEGYMMQSQRSDWRTPKQLFEQLDREFDFTVDAAASAENALLPNYWDKQMNGLIQDWDCERVYVNPPYGREIADWTDRARQSAGLVVALLPVRSDTKWFHDHVMPFAQIRFIRGRLKFDDSGKPAPFPSMVVIWNG